MKLSIRNFRFTVSVDDLRALFAQFGVVSECYIILEKETGLSRGFGFVQMEDPEAAQRAVDYLDGYMWHSRIINVSAAIPKQAA